MGDEGHEWMVRNASLAVGVVALARIVLAVFARYNHAVEAQLYRVHVDLGEERLLEGREHSGVAAPERTCRKGGLGLLLG